MKRIELLIKTVIVIFTMTTSYGISAQSWTDQHTVAPYDLTTDGTNVYKVKYGGSLLYVSNDEAGTWALNDSILFNQPFGTKLGVNIFITSTGRLITSRGTSSTNFKIIYSDDQGLNWVQTSYILTDYHHAIAEINGVIMIKGGNIGLYSTDNGTTWTAVPPAVKYDPVGGDGTEFHIQKSDSMYIVNSTTLAILSRYALPNAGGVLKSFGQHFFYISGGEIFYSTDKQNWNNITPPGSPVVPAVEDVIKENNDIYIATSLGVYKSSDGGLNWSNPGGTSITFADITLTNNYIVAGYHFSASGYTYRLNKTATGIEEHNEGKVELYPNPTKGQLTISTNKRTTAIEIYNILGERVFIKSQAEPQINIDLSHLIKGVYIAHIVQDQKQIVKKFILE